MKKLVVVCVFTLFLGLFLSSAFAIQYCNDFLEFCNPGGWSHSVKTFDESRSVSTPSTYEIDVWLNDVPIPLLTAGFWVVYESSATDLEYVLTYDGYDLPGQWDASFTTKIPEPDGSGTYFIAVADLSTPIIPDGDGDIIIAKLQFFAQSPGTFDIIVSTIPNFDTVVGEDATIFDPQILPRPITISQLA